jgi:Tol biopolymer transport system component
MFAAILAATLTVQDYATLPTITSPRFSPDGKRIAYVISRADMTRSIYDSDIWLVDADGRNDLQLTRSIGADFAPQSSRRRAARRRG